MENVTSMPGPSTHRPAIHRRTYLIDRGFQLKYTVILILVGFAISLLFGALMYQAHVDATALMDLPNPYREVVASSDRMLLWLVIGIAVIMAAALGLFGILVTHKVAGPIYVLSHYVGVLGEGRYPAMRPLRKHDELKEFFERFRVAVDQMRSRDRDEGGALREAAKKLEAAATSADLKAAVDAIVKVAQRKIEAAESAPVG